MKRFFGKWLILVSAIVLAVCGAAAGEAGNGNGPDAAFDAGNLTLVETATASRKPAWYDIEITDGMRAFIARNGGAEDPEALLAEKAPEWESVLVSASPAGCSGIVYSESFGNSMAMALYNGKYRIIYPRVDENAEETAEGVFGFWMTFMSRLDSIIGDQAVLYSPDGRYAVIPNTYGMMTFAGALIDLSTGEMFSFVEPAYENSGLGIGVAFSRDSRYLYYVLGGLFIYRYELDTGMQTLCTTIDPHIGRPVLAELADGSLLMADRDLVKIAAETEDGWIFTDYKPDWPSGLLPGTVEYSPGTGMICQTGRVPNNSFDMNIVFRINLQGENLDDRDVFYCISREPHEVVTLSPDELQAAFEAATVEAKNAKGRTVTRFVPNLLPYEFIEKILFSPDGRYMLLKTIAYGDPAKDDARGTKLFLIRLSDMAIREITGLDAAQICYSRYLPARIEWNTEELLISTEDGIRSFVLSAE